MPENWVRSLFRWNRVTLRLGASRLSYRVIQEEHDCSEPPRPFLVPKNHLANIADIANLGMTEAELPTNQGTRARVRDDRQMNGPLGELTYKART